MEDVVQFIEQRRLSIANNESIASIIKSGVLEDKMPRFVENCYNLTELCNPAHTFWVRTKGQGEKSLALKQLLNWGTILHRKFNYWMRELRDFRTEEGVIDGYFVDIPRVRGRIDWRVGDSIIELKTKKIIPEDVEKIWFSFPQDLEQLAFYSVIHPDFPKINYLIFMKDSSPYEIKVFRMEIKDMGRIKSLLKQRISLLDKAIKEQNPSILGKCRYFGRDCEFEKSKACNCAELEPISKEQLEKSIELFYDEEFTKKIIEIRENKGQGKLFFLNNIISPRRYDLTTEWTPDNEKEKAKAFLQSLIKKNFQKLTSQERQNVLSGLLEKRLTLPYKWVNFKDSIHQESNPLPFIAKVNNKDFLPFRPYDYFIAELGILCASYGKTKGLIFIFSPKKDNTVQVFEVTYKKINEILNKIKETLDNLEKGDEGFLSLPPCPQFFNKEGDCPLVEKCHSEEGSGCMK